MKNIKNFFTNKITMVVLACLLLVGVFAGITVAATEITPELKLVSVNINHEAEPTIKYTVGISGYETHDDAITNINLDQISMKFWAEKPAGLTDTANEVITISDTGRMSNEFSWDDENKLLLVDFYSIGFSPKRMTDTIFASAVLTDAEGNVISQTPVKKYSVYEYLCELNFSNPSADQKALIAAMKEYITYAQDYLGWEEDTAPADLVYVKTVNASFKIAASKDAPYSEELYTAGTFNKGTYFKFSSTDGYVRFVNGDGIVCDQHGDNIYSPGAINSDRMYTAVKGTKFNVETENGAYVQEFEFSTDTAGNAVYTEKSVYENGKPVIILENTANYHRDYALIAPLYNDKDEVLVGWKDENGNPVSSEPMYFFSADLAYTGDVGTIKYSPIYSTITEEADYTHNLLSGEMLLNGNNKDSVETDNTHIPVIKRHPVYAENGTTVIGWTYDCSERVTSGGQPYAKLTDTAADPLATLSKAHVSFNVKIDDKVDDGEVSTNIMDYFIATGNPDLYQNYLGIGNKEPIMFVFRSNSKDAAQEYYTLNIVSNTANANAQRYSDIQMKYGVDNRIDMFIDIVGDETGYNTEIVHYYVNGVYAGSCNVNCTDKNNNKPFTYTGVVSLKSDVLGRCCSLITFSDATVKLWN